MKFLLLLLATLVSLSRQFHYEREIEFPIRAVSVIRGEITDSITNQTYRISGVVHFVQQSSKDRVIVTVDIKGLPPHASDQIIKRGFHIHQYGISDYSDNITAVCGSTGGHFNPTNETHGYLTSQVRHEGDLGNLIVNPDGTVNAILNDDRLALFGKFSIIGRSLVLHGGEDDGGLQNTNASRGYGNSGPRVACGIIAYEKSEIVTARTSLKIDTSRDSFVRYLSLEDPSVNATNATTDMATNGDDLDDISQSFPQAVPIFKLFYKIIKDVSETTRESNFKLLNALDQFQSKPILDVISTLPIGDISILDNNVDESSTPIEATTTTPDDSDFFLLKQ